MNTTFLLNIFSIKKATTNKKPRMNMQGFPFDIKLFDYGQNVSLISHSLTFCIERA